MKPKRLLASLVVVPALAIGGGCGAQDPELRTGNAVDRAFARQMIPHHEMAIAAAEDALTMSDRPLIRHTAQHIVTSQRAEIVALTRAERALADAGVPAGDLGLTREEMGMTGHDPAAMHAARDFDAAFVEMMLPHHMGAIRMAQQELERGINPRLRELAKAMIAAQSHEGGELHRFQHRLPEAHVHSR